METPNYPPATAFEPPTEAPYELGVDTASLADLMRSPTAWAIVVKHAPAMMMVVQTPHTKPYLTNFTVETFVQFGVVTKETVEAVDQELRRLPRSEWPV